MSLQIGVKDNFFLHFLEFSRSKIKKSEGSSLLGANKTIRDSKNKIPRANGFEAEIPA